MNDAQQHDLVAHDAYERSLTSFDAILAQLPEGAPWEAPTPCSEWDVRTLVNHVVGEDRWVPALLAGRTIADVGESLSGDLLGDDPGAAWRSARATASAAAAATPADRPVTLSFGTVPVSEYLWQLAADHLLHGWDLAVAIGAGSPSDAGLIGSVSAWFAEREDDYRRAGAIGPPVPVAAGASTLNRLVARFGRSPRVEDVVRDFGAAFDSGDLERVMTQVSDDIVFESTAPPDGERFVGTEAVRACWSRFFASSQGATFTEESLEVAGARAVVRWRYDWQGAEPGHVRGVDLIRTRDGVVSEKVSYVKG